MNAHHPDDACDGEPLPSRHEIETLLRGRCISAPDAGFRDGVLEAMEGAAHDRRLMLAVHDRIAGHRDRRRLLPESVAGIAAALLVSVVPWGAGSRAVVVPEAPLATPVARAARPADEPSDVHHALALLDARRDLFAAAAGAGRRGFEF